MMVGNLYFLSISRTHVEHFVFAPVFHILHPTSWISPLLVFPFPFPVVHLFSLSYIIYVYTWNPENNVPSHLSPSVLCYGNYTYIYIYIYIYIYLHTHTSIYLSIYLSILSILSIYLSIYRYRYIFVVLIKIT